MRSHVLPGWPRCFRKPAPGRRFIESLGSRQTHKNHSTYVFAPIPHSRPCRNDAAVLLENSQHKKSRRPISQIITFCNHTIWSLPLPPVPGCRPQGAAEHPDHRHPTDPAHSGRPRSLVFLGGHGTQSGGLFRSIVRRSKESGRRSAESICELPSRGFPT